MVLKKRLFMSKYKSTYQTLTNFGKELLEKPSLDDGLPLISEYVKDIIKAQRCSIFIVDKEEHSLWTTLSDGVKKIIVPVDKGLVGLTLKERKPIIENNPYANSAFLSAVDKKTGFHTKNIITSPIFSSKREIIGVLQLLNKEDGFDNEDAKFMIFFSHYISGFLELTNIFHKQQKIQKRETDAKV
jgi:signal transduction protein with GAF and PtsI domain